MEPRRGQPAAEQRAGRQSRAHLDQIAGEEGKYTQSQSGLRGVSGLEAEPGGTHGVEDSGAQSHPCQMKQGGAGDMNGPAGNERQCQITQNVSSGWAQELAQPPGEAGEHGHPRSAKEDIDQDAEGSSFPAQEVQREENTQVDQGYRDRARGDGQRPKHAEHCRHYGCHSQGENAVGGSGAHGETSFLEKDVNQIYDSVYIPLTALSTAF